jgi:putative tricarboxylic transport membrane protein
VLGTKRSTDIATGVFLAVLGLTVAAASTGIGEGAGGQLHPRTFPMILGLLMFSGGAALAIQAAVAKSGGDKAIAWPDRSGWKLLSFAMAGLAAYVAVTQLLGFIISSLIFVPWFIRYFGRYSHLVAWSCAVGIAAFIYLVFIRLLQLTLPIGPLSFLG